jgi:hypothetical protein
VQTFALCAINLLFLGRTAKIQKCAADGAGVPTSQSQKTIVIFVNQKQNSKTNIYITNDININSNSRTRTALRAVAGSWQISKNPTSQSWQTIVFFCKSKNKSTLYMTLN